MWLPPLPRAFIEKISQEVEAFILRQRELHLPSGRSLTAAEAATFNPFYGSTLLDGVRFAPDDGQLSDPNFYAHLRKFGIKTPPSLRDMAAITFVDVIVHRAPLDEMLIFHELVHAEQYRQLGVADFARRYVRGFLKSGLYVDIPLEKQAYELDARFASGPKKAFSVADIVRASIANGGV
jgi:hypothetical protein